MVFSVVILYVLCVVVGRVGCFFGDFVGGDFVGFCFFCCFFIFVVGLVIDFMVNELIMLDVVRILVLVVSLVFDV